MNIPSLRQIPLPVAVVAVLLSSGVPGVAAQRATITFDQSFPVSPLPKYDGEYEDLRAIEDERNPTTRTRLINDFLSDYPDSEYRHLAMRLRFQTRYAAGDPEDIIEAAEEALVDEEYFFNTKLGFMDDPDSVPEVPAFRLDFANQKSIYYESMMEAYRELEDVDNARNYAEMALDAEGELWDLFLRQYGEAAPEYEPELERHQFRQANMLVTLMTAARIGNDLTSELSYAERFLEVVPDDLDTLLRVSEIMSRSDRMPQDPAALAEHVEGLEEYASRAVEAVDALASGASDADTEGVDTAALTSRANSALGMAHLLKGDFGEAAVSLARAAESVPDAQVYFLLGLAHNNDQNVDGAVSALARAVFLGFPQPQARQLLENAYNVKNGSLDGLDDYIQSEGSQITAQ